MYASPVWRLNLTKFIRAIECLQRRATKYILNDYSTDYKTRLMKLHILPLMMQFEINDILFFLRCIKNPTEAFDIQHYIEFCSGPTRSSTSFKLHSISKLSSINYLYLNTFPRLWNSLPVIDMDKSYSFIKYSLKQFFWNVFISTFDPDQPCSYHFLCPCCKCSQLPNIVILSIGSFFHYYVVLVAVGFMGQHMSMYYYMSNYPPNLCSSSTKASDNT